MLYVYLGRARSSESSYVILISNENKAKFMRKYDDFQKIEQHVQRVIYLFVFFYIKRLECTVRETDAVSPKSYNCFNI